MKTTIEGTWPKNDLRRAFVAGAKWWEYHETGGTMWQSDQRLAEDEADKRYQAQDIRGDYPCDVIEHLPKDTLMIKECEWCKKGYKQYLLDNDGTYIELSGKPGTWCHAFDDCWWPCDAPPEQPFEIKETL